MSWDIAPQHEQEYFEFVIREFIPELEKIGFEMGEAWVTVFGKYPQILVAVILPTIAEIHSALSTNQWTELHNKLMEFVINYNQKIVSAKSSFQF